MQKNVTEDAVVLFLYITYTDVMSLALKFEDFWILTKI